jgi:murein DD-endopeptidase MepM/ murein hydrolase activator NlpD
MRRPLGRVAALAALTLVLAAPAGAHTSDPVQLSFEWPALGSVTSPFGWTEGRYHPGIDIGTLRSLTVRAAAPGLVRQVGAPAGFDGYGTIVMIDVGAPFETLYAHLTSARVTVGEQVGAGQPIGVAGCTGLCTGTHLHFELRRLGVAVDPSVLLP